jgi:hypothetical protein
LVNHYLEKFRKKFGAIQQLALPYSPILRKHRYDVEFTMYRHMGSDLNTTNKKKAGMEAIGKQIQAF